MKKKEVKITIDKKTFIIPYNFSIIQAADSVGIYIPRFCYHKKLSIAANCRMCLIDLENSKKPVPACATLVSDGMKIYTYSKKAIEYQKSIMEFLLINHPLDCPICDQGGECDLQDIAMGYGKDISNYHYKKRVIQDIDIGPLIQTDLTRCIHCTRCIRFEKEITGSLELGMLGKGENSEIRTVLGKSINSEMSGNIIDLCPVGALTSKPFRYKARPWEIESKFSISPHDCIGSNMLLQIYKNNVLRVIPAENENINEVWISDRDRFSYEGIINKDRLLNPMIKRDNRWKSVTWNIALEHIIKSFKLIKKKYGTNVFGTLISSNSTVEEFYITQKFMRSFGSNNIDHRIQQKDFSCQNQEEKMPILNCNFYDIEFSKTIWIIGSDIRNQYPILHYRIRRAYLNGSFIAVTNPLDVNFFFKPNIHQLLNIDDIILSIAEVLKSLFQIKKKYFLLSNNMQNMLNKIQISEKARQISIQLTKEKDPILLIGSYIYNHPKYSIAIKLIHIIKKEINARGGILTEGSNTAGAWMAGAIPHRLEGGKKNIKEGIDAKKMLTKKNIKSFILINLELEKDTDFEMKTMKILKESKSVIAITQFKSRDMEKYATVLLPTCSFAENSGSYINFTGKKQYFSNAIEPYGQAKPLWKIIKKIAFLLKISGFNYNSSDEILEEYNTNIQSVEFKKEPWDEPKELPQSQIKIKRISKYIVYGSDMLVRRAKSLQETQLNKKQSQVYISRKTSKILDLKDGDFIFAKKKHGSYIKLQIYIDSSLPDKNIIIPRTIKEYNILGENFNEIILKKDLK